MVSKQELRQWLSLAVSYRWISAAEAQEIREAVDAGRLDLAELPDRIPLEQRSINVTQLAAVAAILAGLLRSSFPMRKGKAESLTLTFAQQARAAAILPLSAWHATMTSLIRQHVAGQYVLGYGAMPQSGVPLSWMLQKQAAYLERFTIERMLRVAEGNPMSIAQIAARSELYGGAGRAAFYMGREATLTSGWIVRYIARDDNVTCSPCLQAERQSPYLPGTGPYPGDVCFGRSRCRCERRDEYNPREYARLGGT